MKVLKYIEFKKEIDSGISHDIYLFEGTDAFFSNRGLLLLKDKFLREPDLNLKVFDETVAEDELIASLESYPFMSDKRITVLKEFYPDKNLLKGRFKSYLDNPYSTSLLVIQNQKPCASLKKFSSVCTVDCNKADELSLSKWIKVEGQKNGVEFESGAIKSLIEYCLSDMTRINTETQKLISYGIKSGIVTAKDVDELVSKETEYKIYQMTACIGNKKIEDALEIINELLGKGEPYQKLLVSVYYYFRQLLHVAISTKTNGELATSLGVEEFVIRRLKSQAQSFKKKSLKSAVDMLAKADYEFKSGVLDDKTAFWLTLFKIMIN